jgi:hypothetical protein
MISPRDTALSELGEEVIRLNHQKNSAVPWGQLSFAYFPLFAQSKVWPGEKSFKKVLPGLDEAPIFF